MTRMPSIGEHPHLRDAPPLSIAERGLLAAFVSGLNVCSFCFGAHRITLKK